MISAAACCLSDKNAQIRTSNSIRNGGATFKGLIHAHKHDSMLSDDKADTFDLSPIGHQYREYVHHPSVKASDKITERSRMARCANSHPKPLASCQD